MAQNFDLDFVDGLIELKPVRLVEYVEKAERELENLLQIGGE